MNRLHYYIQSLEEKGLGREVMLAGLNLDFDSLANPRFIPTPEHYTLAFNNILQAAHSPRLPFELGNQSKINDYGVVGYAALSSKTLKDAREIYMKYDRFVDDIVSLKNVINGPVWWVDLVECFPLGHIAPFVVEEFVSRLVKLTTTLINKPFPIVAMQLNYPAPEHSDLYLEYFGCEPVFGQNKNRITLDAAYLESPISLANDDVFALCKRQCDAILKEFRQQGSLSQEVKRKLLENPGQFLILEEMAHEFNMTARTFRRHLSLEQSSFHTLLDQTRKELALHYLKHTELTPKEIGYALGYSSASNFRRAFKAWTGKTLSYYRKDLAEGGE